MSEDGPDRARQLARDGDLHGAARTLSLYLESTPGDAAAQAELAGLLLDLGDPEGAVQRFERALALEPDDAALHSDLGTALEGAHRESDAAEAYRRAIAIEPRFAPAKYNLALILHRSGQLHEAVGLLRAALDQAPDLRVARRQLGLVFAELGDDDAARGCFESLLAADENDIEVRHDIAGMHMDRCRYADALVHLERCLALAPDDAQAALAMGACLQELGRADEAMEHYRRLLRHDRRRYYEVVKKLTGASKGRFWVDAAELRRVLLG